MRKTRTRDVCCSERGPNGKCLTAGGAVWRSRIRLRWTARSADVAVRLAVNEQRDAPSEGLQVVESMLPAVFPGPSARPETRSESGDRWRRVVSAGVP
jgi:hypothetical protein